jgi:hypothetical protein
MFRVLYRGMLFARAIPNEKVGLPFSITTVCPVLKDLGLGTTGAPSHGQGVLLRWALALVLKGVDKEADGLTQPRSAFHSPENWSWESLQKFSLQSQHDVAVQGGPIIWSVLATVAISKDHRKAEQREEGGRDPWQVINSSKLVHVACI